MNQILLPITVTQIKQIKITIKRRRRSTRGCFCIYNTNSVIGENIKYLASCGDCIKSEDRGVLFDFAISFFNLLPTLSYKVDFLLKTMSIPNDHRLYPVLCYMREHAFRNLKIEQVSKLPELRQVCMRKE